MARWSIYVLIWFALWVGAAGMLLACDGGSGEDENATGDGGPDSDGDADSDADGDVDGGADTDTDSDVDGDADSDADGDADGDADTDGDPCSEPIAVEPIDPPISDDCITSVTAGDHAFNCDGLDFLVLIPERCTEYACGLIFDQHGGTMSGAQMRLNTHLHELAPRCDYIVVHPSKPTLMPYTSSWESLDMPKLADFVERVIEVFQIDTGRVHYTGFSQGGNSSWWMACNRTDLFVSVAPVAAVGPDTHSGAFPPADECGVEPLDPQLHVLLMSGHKDSTVSFENVDQLHQAFAEAHDMQGPTVIDEVPDSFKRTRYTNAQGTVFDFLEHHYGGQAALDGHCIPGGTDPCTPTYPFGTSCTTGDIAFKWGEVVLDWFLEVEGN